MHLTGQQRPVQLQPVGDRTYTAVYYPDKEGPCQVDVKYANEHVPHRYAEETNNQKVH